MHVHWHIGFPLQPNADIDIELWATGRSISGPTGAHHLYCTAAVVLHPLYCSPGGIHSISVCVLQFSQYFHPVGGHMKQIWSSRKVTLIVYFIWHEVGHTFLASTQPYPLSSALNDPDNEHRWDLTVSLDILFWSGVWWIHWFNKIWTLFHYGSLSKD